MDPILGNRVLSVSVRWHSQLVAVDHYFDAQNITIGKADNNQYPMVYDFLPSKMNLIEKKDDSLYLNFLDEFDGALIVDKERIPLSKLRQGKSSGGDPEDRIHQYRFDAGAKAHIVFGDMVFDIRLVPKPDRIAMAGVQVDWYFVGFFLATFIGLIGFGLLLSWLSGPVKTVLTPEEELEKLSERMVEFIIKPPPPAPPPKRIARVAAAMGMKGADSRKGEEIAKKKGGGSGGDMGKGLATGGTGSKKPTNLTAGKLASADKGMTQGGVPGGKAVTGVAALLGAGGGGMGALLGKGPSVGNLDNKFVAGARGHGSGPGDTSGYADGVVGGALSGNSANSAKVTGTGVPGSKWGTALDGYEGGRGKGRGRGSGLGNINIRDEMAEIEGGLTKEEVRRVVEQHLSFIRYCYEKELQNSPNLAGRLEVNWEISYNGSVMWAKKASSTLSNATVEGCIIGDIKKWRFPQAKNGGNTEVTYPFMLQRLQNL